MAHSYYDSIAAGYNELHGEEQLSKFRIIKDNISIGKDDIIADIGGGTGLSSKVFTQKIIVVDPSTQLIALAPKRVKVIKGEIDAIPLPDHSADWVFCITAIHHCKNISQSLAELERIGKESFVITVLKKSVRFNEITRAMKIKFKTVKILDEAHDTIFILKKKHHNK